MTPQGQSVLGVFAFVILGLAFIPMSITCGRLQRELDAAAGEARLPIESPDYGPLILEIERMTRELEVINEELRRINEIITAPDKRDHRKSAIA